MALNAPTTRHGDWILDELRPWEQLEQLKNMLKALQRVNVASIGRPVIRGGKVELKIVELPSVEPNSNERSRFAGFRKRELDARGFFQRLNPFPTDNKTFMRRFAERYIPVWRRETKIWLGQLQSFYRFFDDRESNLANMIISAKTYAQQGMKITQLTEDLAYVTQELGVTSLERVATLRAFGTVSADIVRRLRELEEAGAELQRTPQPKPAARRAEPPPERRFAPVQAPAEGGAYPGKLEDRYTQLQQLGAGAFGVVYSGVRDGRRVAIKQITLPPGLPIEKQQQNLAHAKREIELARQIECTSLPESKTNVAPYCALVPIYDWWTNLDQTQLFIEMQLIDGGSGVHVIEGKVGPTPHTPQDFRFLRQALLGIAYSLQHMHARCVLHRDIKPDNILYDRETQRLYLGDYGLSCVLPGGCQRWAGTPTYADPLILAGRLPQSNEKSDTYALGLSFYELMVRHFVVVGPEVGFLLDNFMSRNRQPVPADYVIQQFKAMVNNAIQEMELLAKDDKTGTAAVLSQVIAAMIQPDDQTNRPTLAAVIRALQDNTTKDLLRDRTHSGRLCATATGGGRDGESNRHNRNTSTSRSRAWYIDQDQVLLLFDR